MTQQQNNIKNTRFGMSGRLDNSRIYDKDYYSCKVNIKIYHVGTYVNPEFKVQIPLVICTKVEIVFNNFHESIPNYIKRWIRQEVRQELRKQNCFYWDEQLTYKYRVSGPSEGINSGIQEKDYKLGGYFAESTPEQRQEHANKSRKVIVSRKRLTLRKP